MTSPPTANPSSSSPCHKTQNTTGGNTNNNVRPCMSLRAIEYNNAGVQCFRAGRPNVAWDLFKGALEVMLEEEQQREGGGGVPRRDACPVRLAYIQKAQEHWQNMSTILLPVDPAQPNNLGRSCNGSTGTIATARTTASSLVPATSTITSINDWQSPYLFDTPFPIRCQPTLSLSTTLLAVQQDSATILFNLAVLHHCRDRLSTQAIHLYELAMTLLEGYELDTLGLAILNNVAVWHFENGDGATAAQYMQHLSNALVYSFPLSYNDDNGPPTSSRYRQEEDCTLLLGKHRMGMYSNIAWLLAPAVEASPAA